MKDEALKLALEALEHPWKAGPDGVADAITAIKETLAQPRQEPVQWCSLCGRDIPLQRTWVDLTDEDCKGMSAGDILVAMWVSRILKEKNGA